VDGLTCRDYEQHLERNLEDLHARVHRGAYRALPSRRVYIPKPDGRQRPIAIATITSNCTSAPSDFGFDGDNPSLSSASWPTIYRPEGQEGFWR
jgi:hypothetical protein